MPRRSRRNLDRGGIRSAATEASSRMTKRRRAKAMALFCYMSVLPDHILKLIFSKLPITSLLQCRYVCKLWRSIILLDQPDFVKRPTSLVLCVDHEKLHWLEFHGQSRFFVHAAELVKKSDRSLPELSIINSCNGLVYLRERTKDFDFIMRILNPITGEYITLPPVNGKFDFSFDICGLGFCPQNKQFKAVTARLAPALYKGTLTEVDYFQAEVYTVGSGSSAWRSIKSVPDFPYLDFCHGQDCCKAYVNGSFNWLVTSMNDFKICTFNFEKEQFGSIVFPDEEFDGHYEWANIGVYGDSLYCCCNQYITPKLKEIWLMKEYGVVESWTRIHIVDCIIELWTNSKIKVIDLFDNGDILLLTEPNLVLFSLEKRSYIRLDWNGIQASIRALVHEPRFASLKNIMKGNIPRDIKKLS